MYICIECNSSIQVLYVEYSKENVKLYRCPTCRSIADKYIEYEEILVSIDLLLHREEVCDVMCCDVMSCLSYHNIMQYIIHKNL